MTDLYIASCKLYQKLKGATLSLQAVYTKKLISLKLYQKGATLCFYNLDLLIMIERKEMLFRNFIAWI